MCSSLDEVPSKKFVYSCSSLELPVFIMAYNVQNYTKASWSKGVKEFLSLKEESRTLIEYYFSNSLIIHQAETKKIITVKKDWIPGLDYHRFYDFIFPFNPQFLFRFRRYIKRSRQCFIGCPNTSNCVVRRIFKFSTFNWCCLRTNQDNFTFL